MLAVLLSWMIDLFWLILFTSDYKKSQLYDGGLELPMRHLALVSSYISFVVRIGVVIVFWRASVDFGTIIGHSRGENERLNRAQSSDFKYRP